MEKITVLLADASAEYRMALREKMEESGDFRIVGRPRTASTRCKWCGR